MTTTQWQYLEKRSHPWRQQLYVKGRKLRVFTLWVNMKVNEMTPEEAADNWNLPLEAIYEAIEYCEANRDLLQQEASEERRRLEEKGVCLEPQISHR